MRHRHVRKIMKNLYTYIYLKKNKEKINLKKNLFLNRNITTLLLKIYLALK